MNTLLFTPCLRDYALVRYCLLLFGLAPFVCVAQLHYNQIQVNTEDYTLTINELRPINSLVKPRLTGLFQDSRGYFWLQSGGHFTRFDGRHFKIVASREINPYDPRENRFSRHVDIDEDIHHNIWRYHRIPNEVMIYDPVANRDYSLQEYLGGDTLPALMPLSHMISMDHSIYLVDKYAGEIWRYDGDSLRQVFKDEQKITPTHVDSICNEQYFPAPDNQFWIIHDKLGLLLCDNRGRTLKRYASLRPAIYGFFIAGGNEMYYYLRNPAEANQPNRVYRAGGSTEPLATLPAGHWEYEQRSFFGHFPLPGHSLTFQEEAQRILTLRDGKSPPKDFFRLIFDALNTPFESDDSQLFHDQLGIPGQTPDGSFWLIVGHSIVNVHCKPKLFKSHFIGRSFRSMAWLDQDRFLGTNYYRNQLQLNLFYPREGTVAPSPFLTNLGSYLVTRHAGETWLGIDNYIEQYDTANRLVVRFPMPMPERGHENYTFSLTFPQPGQVWTGNSNGLLEIDSATGKSRYLLEGLMANHVFRDSSGEHWACTSKGIYHLSSQKMYLNDLPSGIPLDVRHIHEAVDGSFWLATRQGLVHWKPFNKSFVHFTKENGLSNDVLHAVYPGLAPWLWLSSNYGIMAFNTQTYEVRAFFEIHGLANNEQNFLAHGYSPDGYLYFGGINGLTRFDPKLIPPKEHVQKIFVDQITFLHDNTMNTLFQGLVDSFAQPFSLSANTSQLALTFSTPNSHSLIQVVAYWRIKSISPNWMPLNEDLQLQVYGLPAGRFDVEVQIRSIANSQTTKTLVIPFYKAYFFYQRLWFWLLVSALIVLATLLIIRWRLHFLEERNLLLNQMVLQKTQELRHSNANILRQKEQLERMDTSKNHLFNNISHEFRTPLTLIQGYADSLLATPPTNEIKAVIKPATLIKEQSINLSGMIEEIMNLSRLQLGLIKLKKEPVKWTAFLRREFYLFEGQAQRKQLDYRLRIEPDEKVFLAIDGQKMERILNNLISNAIKFTPATGRILISCSIREEEVEVVVADTGPGIPLEEQAHIFDRYFQGSAPLQTSQTGYGIGLALCREYVKLMNGRLWVESRPGEGASFFLTFPKELAPVPVAPPQKRATADEVHPRTLAHLLQPHEQSHLLIVEDNEYIQDFLVEVLAEEYQISIANNGLEALAVLEREPDIDLILSDVMMPVMDGYTLLQKTRSHPVWGFIPFLMLTALTAEEGKLQALRLGVDAFLTKPFEIVELKTQIRNLIRNQQLRKAFLRQTAPASSQEKTLDTSAPVFSAISQEEQLKEESYDEHWMNELQEIVLKSMGKFEFKVSDLAFQLHISERTLRNYIKTYTGLAPSEFLQKARLDRAYQFAKDKKYRTIAEIAYAVGFKDAKHFSKLFTKEFGKSPAEFLK